MSGNCEIGFQNQVDPGRATNGFSPAIGAFVPSTGDRAATAATAQSFQQRWQAILGSFQDSETLVAKSGPSIGSPEQKSKTASVTVSVDRERAVQMGPGSALDKLNPKDSHKSADRRAVAPAATLLRQPSGSAVGGPKMNSGPGDSDSRLEKRSPKNKVSAEVRQTPASNSTAIATTPEVTLVHTSTPLLDLPRSADSHHARSQSQQPHVEKNFAITQNGSWTRPASEQTSAPNNLSIQKPSPHIDSEEDAEKSGADPSSAATPLRMRDDLAQSDSSISAIMGKDRSTPLVQEAAIKQSPTSRDLDDLLPSSTIPIHGAASTNAASPIDRNTGATAPQIDAMKTPRSSISRDAASHSHTSTDSGATTSRALNLPGAVPNSGAWTGEQISVSPRAGNASQPGGAFVPDADKHAVSPEPFTTIDAGLDNPPSKWTLASGHQVEGGFQDSSLGWITVRAQAGTGGIHASVVPSSDVAAQSLTSHLPGLNAHVASQIGHLNPVTIGTSDAGRNSHGAGGEMLGSSSENESGRREHAPAEPSQKETLPNSSRGNEDTPVPSADLPELLSGSTLQERHFSVVV